MNSQELLNKLHSLTLRRQKNSQALSIKHSERLCSAAVRLHMPRSREHIFFPQSPKSTLTSLSVRNSNILKITSKKEHSSSRSPSQVRRSMLSNRLRKQDKKAPRSQHSSMCSDQRCIDRQIINFFS